MSVPLQGSSTSSSSSNMSDEALELPIHIGGCQKWVTGLGRRTTCDDIIYALIRHDADANPNEYVDVTNYAIFERWRGVERPLKGRTKILKVYKAWGAERHHVQFFVRKFSSPLDASIDLPMKPRRSRKSHSHCSKHREKTRPPHSQHPATHQPKSNPTSRESSRVRGRREARTEHKSAESVIPETPQTDNDKVKAKEFQDLVQLIIHQEKRIQEQLSRVHEMDVQIENYETKVHFMRVAENGQNYVQEAYLRDKSEESSSSADDLFPAVKKEDMDTYMHICDSILDIEDKLSKEQCKIADLSVQIQEESVLEPPPLTLDHNDSTDSGNSSNPEERLIVEVERMRKELERCFSLGEAQNHQLALVNETLTECEEQLQKKRDLVEKLSLEAKSAEICGAEGIEYPPRQTDSNAPQTGKSSSEVTLAASSQSQRQYTSVNSTARQTGPQQPAMEQRGISNLPPVTLKRTSDEAVDKSVMDYYVTKTSYYPSTSCTTQYMHQNKHHHFENDSNSDTGLSSLHSDDSPAILETLV